MKKLLPGVIDIIHRYETNDPVELAQKLGFKIVYKELRALGVRGMAVKLLNVQYIIVDSALPNDVKNVVIAHEIGHIFLHGLLSKVIDFHALTKEEKDYKEFEANKFAFLLISHTCLRNNRDMIDGIRYEEKLTVEGVIELLKVFERTVCFIDSGAYI